MIFYEQTLFVWIQATRQQSITKSGVTSAERKGKSSQTNWSELNELTTITAKSLIHSDDNNRVEVNWTSQL